MKKRLSNFEKAYVSKEKSAIEIEFLSGHGDTVAVVTLKAEDARLIQDKEILHALRLQAA